MYKKLFINIIVFCSFFNELLLSQDVKTLESFKGERKIFLLQNEDITCKVIIRDSLLEGDSLVGNPGWLQSYGSDPFSLYTDANFGLQFT